MPLYRMDDLMRQARKQNMALGAFECWESINIQGIAKAAQSCNTPVIFQATPAEYKPMGGADALACMVKFYVDKYNIDAALHLDHGGTLEDVEECIKSGFTSVMLDASAEVFEKNVQLSAEGARMAHSANLSFEAELGHVTGGDGGDAESALTVPAEVVEFVKRTQVDCLAVSIGTVHGDYRGEPKLRLDLLEEIANLVDIPLVLHGGSGTPIDQLHAAAYAQHRQILLHGVFHDVQLHDIAVLGDDAAVGINLLPKIFRMYIRPARHDDSIERGQNFIKFFLIFSNFSF